MALKAPRGGVRLWGEKQRRHGPAVRLSVFVERLVGEGGLEPPPAEPESAVLPLDDSPIARQK